MNLFSEMVFLFKRNIPKSENYTVYLRFYS